MYCACGYIIIDWWSSWVGVIVASIRASTHLCLPFWQCHCQESACCSVDLPFLSDFVPSVQCYYSFFYCWERKQGRSRVKTTDGYVVILTKPFVMLNFDIKMALTRIFSTSGAVLLLISAKFWQWQGIYQSSVDIALRFVMSYVLGFGSLFQSWFVSLLTMLEFTAGARGITLKHRQLYYGNGSVKPENVHSFCMQQSMFIRYIVEIGVSRGFTWLHNWGTTWKSWCLSFVFLLDLLFVCWVESACNDHYHQQSYCCKLLLSFPLEISSRWFSPYR